VLRRLSKTSAVAVGAGLAVTGQDGADGHIPHAGIHQPSIRSSPYVGQVWSVEVELTRKPITRTTGILVGLLAPVRQATVVYLNAPAWPLIVPSPWLDSDSLALVSQPLTAFHQRL
jgi:hypothetical protein